MTKDHAEYVANVIAFFKASKVRVKGERVAIIRDPSHDTTEGGLIIPDEAKRKEPRGTIVALGQKINETEDVAVGERIMYTKYSPISFVLNMPDNSKAEIELFHISDIYLQWIGEECA